MAIYSNKWKTFPCKECLLRCTCINQCFDWPMIGDYKTNDRDLVETYIKENNLENVCLSCESPNVNSYKKGIIQWECDNCRFMNYIKLFKYKLGKV